MAKTPLSDDDVDIMLGDICQRATASEQRTLVLQSLTGRTLTCKQAAALLKAGQAGMQRMLAFEVMQRHLSDFPDGMPHISEALAAVAPSPQLPPSNQIMEIGNQIVSLAQPSSTSQPTLARLREKDMELQTLRARFEKLEEQNAQLHQGITSAWITDKDRKHAALVERIERLRMHAVGENVSLSFYRDLAAAFDASGLAPLPARTAYPTSTAAPLAPTSSTVPPFPAQPRAEDSLDAKQLASLPPLHLVPTAMLIEAVQEQWAEGKLDEMLDEFPDEEPPSPRAESEESV